VFQIAFHAFSAVPAGISLIIEPTGKIKKPATNIGDIHAW